MQEIDAMTIKEKDRAKLERMRHRAKRKEYLIYPEDRLRIHWDLFITLVLLISCMTTPYRIAFGEHVEPMGWMITNYFIDGMFLIDICINFNSAFYNNDYLVVEDRKKIARQYIFSWFLIDLLAIIPFDLFLQNEGY